MVLVDTDSDVCGAGRSEFCCSGCDARGGLVVDGRERGVNGVGGEICSAVEAEDERCWLGEEYCVWAGEEGSEGGFYRVCEGVCAGCVFHDGAVMMSVFFLEFGVWSLAMSACLRNMAYEWR